MLLSYHITSLHVLYPLSMSLSSHIVAGHADPYVALLHHVVLQQQQQPELQHRQSY